MSIRTGIRLALAVAGFLSSAHLAPAESWTVKPRASRHKKLAPELDVLRHCKSRFKGVCRNGKAAFDMPTRQAAVAMQTMSVQMDADETAIDRKAQRLLIRYADLNQKPSDNTLKVAGLKIVEDYEQGAFLLVEPEEDVTSKTVEALIDDDAVVHASPDYIMNVTPIERGQAVAVAATTNGIPNDPLLKNLWGMANIGADQVWPSVRESPNIIVAVIDTGVDYNHPDLRANMWSKNGKFGFDFFDDDDDPMDEQNHGTHCAGTIAGIGNNGVGVVGVSWKAQIMALRFLGPDGTGNLSDAVKAIDFAVENGAHIISNSWAGQESALELSEAITRAEQRGVLFIAAAGNTPGQGNNNDVSPYYPAAYPNANVITVAAIDGYNNRGSFSHYGRKSVDIGAPGVSIMSTVRNNEYTQYDGTSMAAPHVAGAAALIWGKAFSSPAQDRTQMMKVRDLIYEKCRRPIPALKGAWGESPPARVSGGVLDISFLKNNSSPSNPNQNPNPSAGRRLVENRMKVDPVKLR